MYICVCMCTIMYTHIHIYFETACVNDLIATFKI